MLDALRGATLDQASPLFGAIDASRLGMSGHSFGGYTTSLATALDARFKVGIPMAAFVLSTQKLSIPSLTMLGQIDSVVDNDAIRAAHAASGAPKYPVEIKNAGHYAFSDNCFPSADCAPPATLTQDETHDAVRRWVMRFLKVYLADDPSYEPFLANANVPAVVFEAER